MSFNDYLSIAVQNIDDTPAHLLPLTLMDSAAMASHLSPESLLTPAWY